MEISMREKKEAIAYCLTYPEVWEDYPFHDPNWCVIRHKKSKKSFAFIYEKDGAVWINVKCDPQWRDFWREAFASVIPAYHMDKKHWNSIILDGTVPEKDIRRMIGESYDLTKGKNRDIPPGNAERRSSCKTGTTTKLSLNNTQRCQGAGTD
jgi:predicted DNA-binding protein (MmcQ/YjbR family)